MGGQCLTGRMEPLGPPARPQDVFSRRAPVYRASKVHDDKATLAALVERCHLEGTMKVLDAGTGAGHAALAIAPYVRTVHALDITREMLEQGRRLVAERGIANVSFEVGDVRSLPYLDGTFDMVISRRAAHHFHDLPAALREMTRVLCPGGRMVIDDRSVPEDDEVDRTINDLDRLHDPSHVRDRRPSEWSYLLKNAGLMVESVESYRKRVPLSHFTNMVDDDTAVEMHKRVSTMSAHCRDAVDLVEAPEGFCMDNFFIIIVAHKALH